MFKVKDQVKQTYTGETGIIVEVIDNRAIICYKVLFDNKKRAVLRYGPVLEKI